MGQSVTVDCKCELCLGRDKTVGRAALSELQYQALRAAVRVPQDDQDAFVDLQDFLSRFPAPLGLHPVLKRVFYQLAGLPPGDQERVPWPAFVSGLSRVLKRGHTSWEELLATQLWADEAQGRAPDAGGELVVFCLLCAQLQHPAQGAAGAGEGGGGGNSYDSLASALRPTVFKAAGGDAGGVAGGGRAADPGAFTATWLADALPCAPLAVVPRLARALLSLDEPRPAPEEPPIDSRVLNLEQQFLVQGMHATLWGSFAWVPLFRDWSDGRSFTALVKSPRNHKGPLVLVVRTTKNEVLGAVTPPWQGLGEDFQGSPSCLLFALLPTLEVCRTRPKAARYAHLNARNSNSSKGLGFGTGQGLGTPRSWGSFRLWIDADFRECYILDKDLAYTSGSLLPGDDFQRRFDISYIEIWGCPERELAQRPRSKHTVFQRRATTDPGALWSPSSPLGAPSGAALRKGRTFPAQLGPGSRRSPA